MTTRNETEHQAPVCLSGDPPIITQAELAQLGELRRQKTEVGHRLTDLRNEIREKLDCGAPVQPGRLTAELRTTESRTFGYDKLVAILGERVTDDLRNRIERTRTTQVVVHTSESSAS